MKSMISIQIHILKSLDTFKNATLCLNRAVIKVETLFLQVNNANRINYRTTKDDKLFLSFA